MSDIQLYDATLRDGMQGPGLTLSAAEKVRVARKLDELGVHLIEAGFPSSNPKELELFELLAAGALRARRRRRLRHDAPARRRRPPRTTACACSPTASRRCARIVGKTWGLHLEKVVRVDRAENLAMIAESVAFLVAAGKRVVYDAEHFFDGYRDDPGYALDCLRAAAGAGAETVALCDTNGSSLPPQVAEATAAVLAAVGDRVRVAIHCHNDAECGVANTLAAVEVGARQVQGTMNGVGERTGNANLVSIIANLQLKMGRRVLADEQLAHLTEAAHFVDELLNRPPNRAQAYVGRDAFAHKGGLHVAGVRADSATFEHVEPGAGRQHARAAGLRARGAPHGGRAGRRRRARLRRRRRPARHRPRQAARARRLSVRGRRRLLRPAPAPRVRRLRAALPPGVLARDRRAARRRQGRDRGDDQDLGRRRALRPHRRGQRPRQRARRRAARRASARSTRT